MTKHVPDDRVRPRIVFIASSSFSGSTTLGLVLGADPRAVFLGEPNQIVRPGALDPLTGKDRRVCTCGAAPEACGFWSSVRERYRSGVNLNPAPGLSWANLRLMLRILSPFPLRRSEEPSAYATLLAAVFDAARDERPGLELVVDGSKSIQSLDALVRSPDIDVVVVHLVRDCEAVADSYKDRGSTALYGTLIWGLVNGFLSIYLRRSGIPTITIGYEAFCRSPGTELGRLNRFLSTSLNADTVDERVREEPYHLFSGNKRVRDRIRGFSGIRYRPARGHLGRLERVVAGCVGRYVRGRLGVSALAPSAVGSASGRMDAGAQEVPATSAAAAVRGRDRLSSSATAGRPKIRSPR